MKQLNINKFEPATEWFDLDIGSKTIKYRKWKNKDRKLFKEAIKNSKQDHLQIVKHTLNFLVYNCLDKEYALSPSEIQYILIKIREKSIGSEIMFKYHCKECGTENYNKIDLSKLKFKHKKVDEIVTGNYIIKLGEVKNIKLYNENILKSDSILDDLIYKIESINGKTDFSAKEVEELFDSLDTDIIDEIVRQFKENFIFENSKEFKCEKCNYKNNIAFDNMPDFLPESWLQI